MPRRKRAGRCRSPRHVWVTSGMPSPAPTTVWGSTTPRAGTRCSATWCWRGSSSRPASSTRCACWRKRASSRPSIARPSAGCLSTRPRAGGRHWLPHAHDRPGWVPPRSCSATCRPVLRNRRRDGFCERGFSKERRLEPQITIGLLTDSAGLPLMVNAFEGYRGEPVQRRAGAEARRPAPPARRPSTGWRKRASNWVAHLGIRGTRGQPRPGHVLRPRTHLIRPSVRPGGRVGARESPADLGRGLAAARSCPATRASLSAADCDREAGAGRQLRRRRACRTDPSTRSSRVSRKPRRSPKTRPGPPPGC